MNALTTHSTSRLSIPSAMTPQCAPPRPGPAQLLRPARYRGREGCFLAIDEGDYNALPQDLIDRIVHSVPGMMADDFDEANIARAASFMSVVMDPEWDADCPF
jgi:hypothetical protein